MIQQAILAWFGGIGEANGSLLAGKFIYIISIDLVSRVALEVLKKTIRDVPSKG